MNFSPISFFHVHVFIHESCKQVDADRGDGQSFQFFDSTSRIDSIDGIGWDGLGRQAELESRETAIELEASESLLMELGRNP